MICIGQDTCNLYKPISSNIYKAYTFKEIISDDFLFNFYPTISLYTGNSLIEIFNAFKGGIKRPNMYKNLTVEEARYVLNKYIDAVLTDSVDKWSFQSLMSNIYTISENKIEQTEIMTIVFEKEIFKKLKVDNEIVGSFLDKIVSEGIIENSEMLIKQIQEQVPDYKNFPLIILNPNISPEEKTKALKLVYRQKDIPQYKKFLRESIIDLNDLDTFIEATIIQNNRVKEKEDNIIRLFKDIFVSGEYSCRNVSNKNFKNKESFSKKYYKYFDNERFTRRFYSETVSGMSTNTYIRREQYENFISLIFSYVDTRDQLEIMTKCPELKCLGNMFPNKFNNLINGQIEADDELEKMLVKIFITWSKNDLDDFIYNVGVENYETVLSKYASTEILDEYFEKLNILKCTIRQNGSNFYLRKHANIDVLTKLFNNIDALKKTSFMTEYNLNALGFVNDEIVAISNKDRWRTYDLLESRVVVGNETFSALRYAIKTANKDILEAIREKFTLRFINSENTEFLSSNVMELHSNPNITKVSKWSGELKFIDCFNKVFNTFKLFVSELYERLIDVDSKYGEEYEQIKSNLDGAENTINLVCASI